MSSGAEYDFYKKLRQENAGRKEEERLPDAELKRRARDATRELEKLNMRMKGNEKEPISAEELLDRHVRPDDIKKLDREEDTSFFKTLFNK